jgi:hypothetical protein
MRMPTYALVHFPSIDTTRINAFRDEYDPYKDLIDVHISVVFPVALEPHPLQEHISEILAGWIPFTIQLKGLHLSFDQRTFDRATVNKKHQDYAFNHIQIIVHGIRRSRYLSGGRRAGS